MSTDPARTLSLEMIVIDAAPMEIECENFVAKGSRPIIPEVNHQSTVRVATAEDICTVGSVARIHPGTCCVPMIMIRMLIDEFVAPGLEMLAVHPLKPGTGNCLPEVTDNRV